MSRTYRKKIRIGICTGSNTEYYRDRRRKERRHNKHELRNKLANINIEDLDDSLEFIKLHKKDSWDEPTDGTWVIDNLYLQKRLNRLKEDKNNINKYRIPYDLYDYLSLKKKYGKYLKK